MVGPLGAGGRGIAPPAVPPAARTDTDAATAASSSRGPSPQLSSRVPASDVAPPQGAGPSRLAELPATAAPRSQGRPATAAQVARVAPPLPASARRQ